MIYYWCLAVVVGYRDGPFGGALGRELSPVFSRRGFFDCGDRCTHSVAAGWRNWFRVHLAGMGLSYILMLTAFYVDNGKNCHCGASFHSGLSGFCRPCSGSRS